MYKPKQLAFKIRTHGGKRRGAGRKVKGARRLVSHKPRPAFERPTPVHVTVRLREHVWSLRSRRCFTLVARAFSKARDGLRIVEFSAQGNHLHLVVEADDSRTLSRGMQAFCIRLARSLNRLMKRTGKVFADHFHSRLLRTPTELTRAIAYVLGNHGHHFGTSGPDPYSSAAREHAALLAQPVSWLLRTGRYRPLHRLQPPRVAL
jgi:putative transposase